jgi:DNA-binding NtrC family response regulator
MSSFFPADPARTLSRSRRAPRVLVVDDEADRLELLELTLVGMGMGMDVDCAADLATARRLLAAGRYALCLTDMRLPDGDGLTLVAEIGASYPETPVAVITAYGSGENAVAALKAGAFDYLSKPVGLEVRRAMVRSAVGLASAAPAAASLLPAAAAAARAAVLPVPAATDPGAGASRTGSSWPAGEAVREPASHGTGLLLGAEAGEGARLSEDGIPDSLPIYLDAVERAAILRALEKTQHNRTAAARLLGVSFRAPRHRMQRLGIP